MPDTDVLPLRLNSKLKKKLDNLAKATERSRSFLVVEAILEYVALNEWQIEEIKKGLREADAGDFATDRKWNKQWPNGSGVRVKWLRAAIANLQAEADYITQDSPLAAALKLIQAVERLKNHPARGCPGRLPGTRELVITGAPYIIPYRLRGGTLRSFESSMPLDGG